MAERLSCVSGYNDNSIIGVLDSIIQCLAHQRLLSHKSAAQHCENLPMQYSEIFSAVKNENFT